MIDYSIIIPAFNEEELLGSTLKHVREAMSKLSLDGEIVVVDNNSTDKTSEIADSFGVVKVFEPINQISKARNTGAKASKGKYLVFLDADSILSFDLLSEAFSILSSEKYVGGGVLLKFTGNEGRTVRIFSSIWNFFSKHFNLAAGSFIFCTREAFEAVGGYSEKIYASEDVWFSDALKKWGRKRKLKFKVITNNKLETSARKFNSYSPLKLYSYLFLFMIFPFSVFMKRLCGIWYKR